MQIEMIEGMIANKLELSGMKSEGAEGQCRSLLHRLYTAVELCRLMIPEEKQLLRDWHEVFAKDFRVNLFLKELKSKKNKEKTAPAPHRKEKTIKEKVQKTLPPLSKKENKESDGKDELKERQKAFWAELEPYCSDRGGMYKRKTVLKFFYYWAQEVKQTGTMRWENEEVWTTEFALAGWSKKPFETYAEAAELRLDKAKAKGAPKQPVVDAADRAEANARLEREIAERKAGAVSYDEYLKMKLSLADNADDADLPCGKMSEAEKSAQSAQSAREMKDEK